MRPVCGGLQWRALNDSFSRVKVNYAGLGHPVLFAVDASSPLAVAIGALAAINQTPPMFQHLLQIRIVKRFLFRCG